MLPRRPNSGYLSLNPEPQKGWRLLPGSQGPAGEEEDIYLGPAASSDGDFRKLGFRVSWLGVFLGGGGGGGRISTDFFLRRTS